VHEGGLVACAKSSVVEEGDGDGDHVRVARPGRVAPHPGPGGVVVGSWGVHCPMPGRVATVTNPSLDHRTKD
jgi:hypothetical protein